MTQREKVHAAKLLDKALDAADDVLRGPAREHMERGVCPRGRCPFDRYPPPPCHKCKQQNFEVGTVCWKIFVPYTKSIRDYITQLWEEARAADDTLLCYPSCTEGCACGDC